MSLAGTHTKKRVNQNYLCTSLNELIVELTTMMIIKHANVEQQQLEKTLQTHLHKLVFVVFTTISIYFICVFVVIVIVMNKLQ